MDGEVEPDAHAVVGSSMEAIRKLPQMATAWEVCTQIHRRHLRHHLFPKRVDTSLFFSE